MKFIVLLFLLLSSSTYSLMADAQAPVSVIENDLFRFRFSCSDGLHLQELLNKKLNDNFLKSGSDARLFVVTMGGTQYSAADFSGKAAMVKGKKESTWNWNGVCADAGLAASISIRYGHGIETAWRLTIKYTGDKAERAKIAFPVLDGLTIGPAPESNRYFHGLNGGFMGDMPIQSFKAMYGYSLPVMDVYDIKARGGLYVRVNDTSNCHKVFDVAKRLPGSRLRYDDVSGSPRGYTDVLLSDRLGMAVHYLERELTPGSSFTPPAAVVAVHTGDWRQGMEAYSAWVRTWYKSKAPRPQWFRQVFVHKALHVQHIHPGEAYTILSSVQPMDDVFNLNHWMVSRGDYQVRPDWGGASALRKQLALVRNKSVRSVLYLEGLCVDRESPVGKDHGTRWAVLQDGKRVTSEPTVEWNFCPGERDWERYLADSCASALRETDCDGIYLDSIGLRYNLCEDTAHGHVAGAGWYPSIERLLRAVRGEMNRIKPQAVLYLEYLSSDVNTQYLDGCFSPCVTAALTLRERGLNLQPTGTNLFRFYFPEFKFIEICPENREGIGLSFFNGNGIHGWLTNTDIRPYVEKLSTLFHEYSDAFTSEHPVPYVSTLQEGVFANAFPGHGRTLYTLYNSNDKPVQGEVLSLPSIDACTTFKELIESRELTVSRKNAETKITTILQPREVLCIAAIRPLALPKSPAPSGSAHPSEN